MTAEEAGRARSRDGDSDPPASELPESIEWVVYAPADIVANQLTDMLRAARFDAQLVPDFYRYDPPNPFGVSVIAPPTAVAPLGTFSGGIRARIQSHNVWLGAAKVLGLPGGHSTLKAFPDDSPDTLWGEAERNEWRRLPTVIQARFAQLGLEWDDMRAPGFTGPRRAEESRTAITKPSERSMWVDPVFEARGFQRRDDLCFVVMPFRPELRAFYNSAVKPVVEELGLACQLASYITAGHRDVVDEIWVALNEARLVVADLTGQNANVFYELGIASTLGKHVIAICKRVPDSQEGKLPFDVIGRRTIFYEDTAAGAEAFKQDLRRHIKTILESHA